MESKNLNQTHMSYKYDDVVVAVVELYCVWNWKLYIQAGTSIIAIN